MYTVKKSYTNYIQQPVLVVGVTFVMLFCKVLMIFLTSTLITFKNAKKLVKLTSLKVWCFLLTFWHRSFTFKF
jgi:hypothetical protein